MRLNLKESLRNWRSLLLFLGMNYSNIDARLSQTHRLNPGLVQRIERLRRISRKARTLQEKMALAAQIDASRAKTSGSSRG